MRTRYFAFFDFVRMQWHNPLWTCLPDYAVKYSYFQTPEQTFSQGNHPVQITVHSSPPPADVTCKLALTSERFYGGRDLFRVDHQMGCRRWHSWVSGLFSNNVHIWYHFPWYQRTRPISWLSSDLLICFHVIQPVLEYKLLEQGVAVLHAGGAVKNGRAVLLAGRGGTRKTTLLMKLMRAGWHYLADDLILLHRKTLYPNPQSPGLLDYLYLNKADEHYTWRDYPGLFYHLWRNPPISYPVAGPTPPAAVIFLQRTETAEECRPLTFPEGTDETMLRKILAVNRLERVNCMDYDDAAGRFMLHLNQIEGDDTWGRFWEEHYTLLAVNLSGLSCRQLAIGQTITDNVLHTLEELV